MPNMVDRSIFVNILNALGALQEFVGRHKQICKEPECIGSATAICQHGRHIVNILVVSKKHQQSANTILKIVKNVTSLATSPPQSDFCLMFQSASGCLRLSDAA
eukprot:Lithocolla_globosa_v1_NODE_1189_length_2799_cov_6.159621.p3 type:complete len:104 gc:universal NODE_1189_length_2799_cov_6.159621:370-59(-)